MPTDDLNNLIGLDDASLLTMIIDGTLTRNRSYEFFSTERGKTIHRQAKTLQGVLLDMKNGAKVVSEGKDEWGWRIVLENAETRYRRTVIMSPDMHEIFRQRKKRL